MDFTGVIPDVDVGMVQSILDCDSLGGVYLEHSGEKISGMDSWNRQHIRLTTINYQ